MKKTVFLENALNYINNKKFHYLYGYKGETITHEKNIELRKQYPRVWTIDYLNNAEGWIGDNAVDCSGLICISSGNTQIGSYQMEERWEKLKEPISGAVGWRKGHVAIVESCQGDYIIILEAAGQKAGLRRRTARKSEFKEYLKVPGVVYDVCGYWYKVENKWRYRDEATGEDLKDGYYRLKWSGGEGLFYFDKLGSLIITDREGVIQ